MLEFHQIGEHPVMMGPLDFGNQEYERDQSERVGRGRRDEREAVTTMCVALARYALIGDLTYFLLAFHLWEPPETCWRA